MYRFFIKPLFDFLLSFFAILFLALPMLIIAIAIKCDSKGSVFFTQKRVGKNKKLFTILKFRTMRSDTPHDAPTHELIDPKKWITRVGGFLRKTSLDELPQLWNVIKGDMSLVGTRPPTVDEWEQYEPHHRARMAIKPGITGMWQVSGRSDITDFEEVVQLDTEYIEKWNLGLDIKILLMTVVKVFKNDGAV